MPSVPLGGGASPAAFALKINGVDHDYRAARIQFDELDLYVKDGRPAFRFSIDGGAIPTTDPYKGKSVELWIDAGLGRGSLRRFSGRCERRSMAFGRNGWRRSYTCYDLRWMGDLIPHTDAVDGTDATRYNAEVDDPSTPFLGGRVGRTQGQILLDALHMPGNAAALTAMGIGGFTSTGYGAAASVSLVGGAVGTPVVTTGGSGYAVGDAVYFSGGGGAGAYGHVSAVDGTGAVTAIAIDRAGAGFLAPPQVVISSLPLVTVRDLCAMGVVIPYPVTIAGEKLLEAIEGRMRDIAPCHMLWVRPSDKAMRFLDTRTFGGPVARFYGTGSGASVQLAVNASGQVTGIVPGSLVGGSGYTSAPLIDVVAPIGSGAALTCTVSAGAVDSVSVSAGGSNYRTPLTLALDAKDASGRIADPDSIRWEDISELGWSRVSIRAGQPRTDGVWVGLAPPPGATTGNNGLIEYFDHDGLTNSQAKSTWKLADFSIPDGSANQATFNVTVTSGVITNLTLQSPGGGYSTAAGAVHIRFVPVSPAGGSGASATAVVNASGQVTGFTGLSGGSGYTAGKVNAVVDMPSGGGADVGTCTCPSTLTVTVTSTDASKTWPANYWDQSAGGRKGVVFLVKRTGTGLDSRVMARVVSNTALTPGGTSTLTLDIALPNLLFDSYKITGTAGAGSIVWRRYKVVDPALARAMAQRFSVPIPAVTGNGSAAMLVSQPFVKISYSSTGAAPFFEAMVPATFDPTDGTLTTAVPVVTIFGSTTALQQGGSATDGIPSDVQAFLAIYKTALHVESPADSGGSPQFAGTLHSALGVDRTLTVTVPGWRDPANTAAMKLYADELLDSVKDEARELSLEVCGLYEEAWDAGCAAGLAGSDYATGLESANLPVLACSLRWDPRGGAKYRTRLTLSNRRAHFSAESFLRPSPAGSLIPGPSEAFGYDAVGYSGGGASPADDLAGLGGAMIRGFSAVAGDMLGAY